MTENKRFIVDKRARLEKPYAIRDYEELINQEEICDVLNELHEENQSIKKHIGELYKIVKFDVGNEIEGYPKVLLEYIVNILKIIGDVE